MYKTLMLYKINLLNQRIKKLQQAALHRPFDFESESHQKFISDQLSLIDELTKKHPFLNLEKEKNKIKQLK